MIKDEQIYLLPGKYLCPCSAIIFARFSPASGREISLRCCAFSCRRTECDDLVGSMAKVGVFLVFFQFVLLGFNVG